VEALVPEAVAEGEVDADEVGQAAQSSAALGHSPNIIHELIPAALTDWAARASAVPSSGIRTSSSMALRILIGLPVANNSRRMVSWEASASLPALL